MPWLLTELALAEPNSVHRALGEHVFVLARVESALATLALLLGLGLLLDEVRLLDRLLLLLLLLLLQVDQLANYNRGSLAGSSHF